MWLNSSQDYADQKENKGISTLVGIAEQKEYICTAKHLGLMLTLHKVKAFYFGLNLVPVDSKVIAGEV